MICSAGIRYRLIVADSLSQLPELIVDQQVRIVVLPIELASARQRAGAELIVIGKPRAHDECSVNALDPEAADFAHKLREQLQVLSILKRGPKKLVDPRHTPVKELLARFWGAESPGIPMPWGPADAGALGQLLKANPTMTEEEIRQLLVNRFKSDDHARGEPVFVWIKYLTRYLDGPLDKYKQPIRTSNGTNKPNRADEGNAHAVGATSAALARVRGVARG